MNFLNIGIKTKPYINIYIKKMNILPVIFLLLLCTGVFSVRERIVILSDSPDGELADAYTIGLKDYLYSEFIIENSDSTNRDYLELYPTLQTIGTLERSTRVWNIGGCNTSDPLFGQLPRVLFTSQFSEDASSIISTAFMLGDSPVITLSKMLHPVKIYNNYFRFAGSDENQAQSMVKLFLLQNWKRIKIVQTGTEVSTFMTAFTTRARASGIKIVTTQQVISASRFVAQHEDLLDIAARCDELRGGNAFIILFVMTIFETEMYVNEIINTCHLTDPRYQFVFHADSISTANIIYPIHNKTYGSIALQYGLVDEEKTILMMGRIARPAKLSFIPLVQKSEWDDLSKIPLREIDIINKVLKDVKTNIVEFEDKDYKNTFRVKYTNKDQYPLRTYRQQKIQGKELPVDLNFPYHYGPDIYNYAMAYDAGHLIGISLNEYSYIKAICNSNYWYTNYDCIKRYYTVEYYKAAIANSTTPTTVTYGAKDYYEKGDTTGLFFTADGGLLRDIILRQDFYGLTGRVAFDQDTHERIPYWSILNIVNSGNSPFSTNNTLYKVVGYIDKNNTIINKEVIYQDGTSFVPYDSDDLIPGKLIPITFSSTWTVLACCIYVLSSIFAGIIFQRVLENSARGFRHYYRWLILSSSCLSIGTWAGTLTGLSGAECIYRTAYFDMMWCSVSILIPFFLIPTAMCLCIPCEKKQFKYFFFVAGSSIFCVSTIVTELLVDKIVVFPGKFSYNTTTQLLFLFLGTIPFSFVACKFLFYPETSFIGNFMYISGGIPPIFMYFGSTLSIQFVFDKTITITSSSTAEDIREIGLSVFCVILLFSITVNSILLGASRASYILKNKEDIKKYRALSFQKSQEILKSNLYVRIKELREWIYVRIARYSSKMTDSDRKAYDTMPVINLFEKIVDIYNMIKTERDEEKELNKESSTEPGSSYIEKVTDDRNVILNVVNEEKPLAKKREVKKSSFREFLSTTQGCLETLNQSIKNLSEENVHFLIDYNILRTVGSMITECIVNGDSGEVIRIKLLSLFTGFSRWITSAYIGKNSSYKSINIKHDIVTKIISDTTQLVHNNSSVGTILDIYSVAVEEVIGLLNDNVSQNVQIPTFDVKLITIDKLFSSVKMPKY